MSDHRILGLSSKEATLLSTLETSVASALELRKWWEQTSRTGAFADRFELARTFNRPDLGVGFFDTVNLTSGPLRVMGVDQEMHFTWPSPDLDRLRRNFREYILHYFLRATDYSPPSAYYETGKLSAAPFLRLFSWCPNPAYEYQGFGYSQRYFSLPVRRRGRFPAVEQYRITDLRRLGPEYEWIVASVKILDFTLRFEPLGTQAPQFSIPLQEDTLVVLTPDFIIDRERPEPGVVGEYGLGYALLAPSSDTSILVYGPGRFTAGFQLIIFRLLEDGTTCVRLIFVVNRPEKILNINFDLVRWGFQFADLFSFGLASRVFAPLRWMLDAVPLQLRGFDPVTSFVQISDVLSNGLSSEFCISIEHLEKYMLMVHFQQHYSMIVSALLTFGQTKDWMDRESIPAWAIEGIAT